MTLSKKGSNELKDCEKIELLEEKISKLLSVLAFAMIDGRKLVDSIEHVIKDPAIIEQIKQEHFSRMVEPCSDDEIEEVMEGVHFNRVISLLEEID